MDPSSDPSRGAASLDAPLAVVGRPRRQPPRMLIEMGPFLLIGIAVALLIPGPTEARIAGAIACTVLAVCRGYASVHPVAPTARLLPAVAFAFSIGTLAAITAQPLYDVILCLNVLLIALQENRRILLMTIGFTFVALLVPAIINPEELALRAGVWALLLPVLSLPVQRRSAELRERVELGPRLRDLQARMLAAGDPRRTLVRATPELAGCDLVSLVEPDSAGRWTVTETNRDELLGTEVPEDERSPVRRAISERRPSFVPDSAAAADLVPRLASDFGEVASWLCVPVNRGGLVAAVLCVGWNDPVRRADDLRIDVVRSLASEASTTIDHTELLQALNDTASSDELTGLVNRRGWDSLLATEMAVCRQRGTPLSVAIVDLDHFKHFNDVHGHRAGDRLLREAAGAWTGVLRRGDQLARWGGEEFTLLLPNCPGDCAMEVVERLRAATPGDQTCSAGIASWDGLESATALFERMDQALYEAKTGGRDSSVLAPYPFEEPVRPVYSPS